MQDHHFTLDHTQGQQLIEECTLEALYILDIIPEAHIVMAGTLEVTFTDGIQDTHIAMAGMLEALLVTDKTLGLIQKLQTQIPKIHVAVTRGRKINNSLSAGAYKKASIFQNTT